MDHLTVRAESSAATNASELHALFEDAVLRVCRLAGIAPEEQHFAVASRAFELGGVPFALEFDEPSGFVKVYADAGRPSMASAPGVYRALLEHQLYFPPPFQVLVGVHPLSEHIVIYACAPLPSSAQSDDNFLALLHSCVNIVRFLSHEVEGMHPLQ